MKYAALTLCCCLAIGCNESAKAPAPAPEARAPKVLDADNSAVNVRDRDKVTKTPIDQNENKDDVETTAAIRKRIVDGKMSVNAQNVKVITQDGKVTLRGPVESADEKDRIEEMAVAVAGAGNIDNQLEVKVKE